MKILCHQKYTLEMLPEDNYFAIETCVKVCRLLCPFLYSFLYTIMCIWVIQIMANSKAPKHDFAPAWLKIPSNEGLVRHLIFTCWLLVWILSDFSLYIKLDPHQYWVHISMCFHVFRQKPSGSKSADHGDKSGRPRRDDYHAGFNRFASNEYMYGAVQRQRSFDSYYDGRYLSACVLKQNRGWYCNVTCLICFDVQIVDTPHRSFVIILVMMITSVHRLVTIMDIMDTATTTATITTTGASQLWCGTGSIITRTRGTTRSVLCTRAAQQ